MVEVRPATGLQDGLVGHAMLYPHYGSCHGMANHLKKGSKRPVQAFFLVAIKNGVSF
jgi:hypothetical protein